MQGRASLAARWPLAIVLTLAATLAIACASATGTPRPRTPASIGRPVADAPAAEAEPPSPRTSKTSRTIADTALTLRGIRYRPGGSNPQGFDCSGFTMYVFGQHGIDLPRNTSDQYHEGKPIKQSQVAAGDLLFFKTVGRDVTHVAISIGGQGFVHAPSSNGVVRVESLETTYWASRFLGARRVK